MALTVDTLKEYLLHGDGSPTPLSYSLMLAIKSAKTLSTI